MRRLGAVWNKDQSEMVDTTQTQIGSDARDILGTADITIGEDSQDINIALILDNSYSTTASSGVDLDGDIAHESFL
jgi:hypothetical protein